MLWASLSGAISLVRGCTRVLCTLPVCPAPPGPWTALSTELDRDTDTGRLPCPTAESREGAREGPGGQCAPHTAAGGQPGQERLLAKPELPLAGSWQPRGGRTGGQGGSEGLLLRSRRSLPPGALG